MAEPKVKPETESVFDTAVPTQDSVFDTAPTENPPSQSPTYDAHKDLVQTALSTLDRLGQAHSEGFGKVSDKFKALPVLFGQVSYEDYTANKHKPLNENTFANDELFSQKYIPGTTELMVPMFEMMPEIETTLAAVGAGAGIGAGAGLVTGPAAPAAALVGALFGSTGLPFAVTAAADAGEIYTLLREKGASHDLARNIAIPAGLASGSTWLLNTNAWTGAFRSAFKREVVKHLKTGVGSSAIGKYMSLVGTGALAGGIMEFTKEEAQELAHVFDQNVAANSDWGMKVAEQAALGGLTSLGIGIGADKAGWTVGKVIKQMRLMQDHMNALGKPATTVAAKAAPVKVKAAPPALNIRNPEKAQHVETAEATERSRVSLTEWNARAATAESQFQILQQNPKATKQKLALAARKAKLSAATRDLATAEAALRNTDVKGEALGIARQKAADALADMLDAAAIGSRYEQLVDPTIINLKEKFGNSLQTAMRGWTSWGRSYEQKFRLALQLDPEAEALAANFSLTKARDRVIQIEQTLETMFKEIITDRMNKSWSKVQDRIHTAQTSKVKFTHTPLPHVNKGQPVEVTMTEDKLLKLYNEIVHDVADSRKGHERGNGYDLNYDNPNSLIRKVRDLVESDPDRRAMADANQIFYRKRAPLVEAYIERNEGEAAALPEGYSGKLNRPEAKDFELDPRTGGSAWVGSTHGVRATGPMAGRALRRNPDAEGPIETVGMFSEIVNSNRNFANAMAFQDLAPIHHQLLEKSTTEKRIAQVMGDTKLLDLLKEHLKDIVVNTPKAQHLAEKFVMGATRAMYTIRLGADAAQFVKQQSSLFSSFAYAKDPRSIFIGLHLVDKERAFFENLISRDIGTQGRFDHFFETATGIPVGKFKQGAGWYEKTMQLPIKEGDKETTLKTTAIIYIDGLRQGFGHTKSMANARKVNELLNSTGTVELLPSIARKVYSPIGQFMVQPQLMMSKMNDLWRDVFNFGLGQAGAERSAQAWKEALIGTSAIKLSVASYAGLGLAAKSIVDTMTGSWDDDKFQHGLLDLTATAAGGADMFDYPVLTDIRHSVYVSAENLVLNKKLKRWELKTIPGKVAEDSGAFMYDVYALYSNPETTVTWGSALADWSGSVFNITRIPSAPVKAASKVILPPEDDSGL